MDFKNAVQFDEFSDELSSQHVVSQCCNSIKNTQLLCFNVSALLKHFVSQCVNNVKTLKFP